MIKKEFRQIFRDPPMIAIIFLMPVVQMLVLSFAITTEIKHVKLAVADLDNGVITPAWQAALQTAVARTRDLFAAGKPVADGVHGRLRYELRATWLGGMRILDTLESIQFDVFNRRPTLRLHDGLVIALNTVFWKRPNR